MVQLALAVASILVLPSLSSFGAYAAPLPSSLYDLQQAELHVQENPMSTDFEARFKRPMKFYHERELAEQGNVGWTSRPYRPRRAGLANEEAATNSDEGQGAKKPGFIRRRSTPLSPNTPHRRAGRPRFASGKGRKAQKVYGGMYISGRPEGVAMSVSSRQNAQSAAGVPGKVSVVQTANNSTSNVDLAVSVDPIASLVFSLVSNSSAGIIKATASADNHTTIYLTPAVSNGTAPPDPATRLVNLKMAVFDPQRASLVQYCATYDPAPSNSSSITAEPCETVAAAHSSQVFMYHPDTGTVHPVWTDATPPAGPATSNTSALFANGSSGIDPSVKLSNATSTVITCHPDSHYVTNALLSDPGSANMTAAPAVDGQSMFALVFIPDANDFLVAPSAPAANVTGAPLAQHIEVVGSHSEPAPPTFTHPTVVPTSTLSSPVNAVHLAEALVPMIPLPGTTDGSSSMPAPSPTGV